MSGNFRRILLFGLVTVLGLSIFLLSSGCGQKTVQAPAKVAVKAMQVIVQDTPIVQEFVGEVVAKESVELKARVSGQIVGKKVSGGERVAKGQPLFQIDKRDYEAVLLNRKATLAQTKVELSDIRLDVERYQLLYESNATSRQSLDQILNKEQQKLALLEANEALVSQAQIDVDDTLITAPISGRISLKELGVGNYVQAGQTVLANIYSTDPIQVQFSISENSYLEFTSQYFKNKDNHTKSPEVGVSLKLSDGKEYPFQGRFVEVDAGLSGSTGSLTMKAEFDNPHSVLMPGMFAKVSAEGNIQQGALLVPQRAIQETLGKSFVTVIISGPDGDKAESRAVKLGPKSGNMQIIEEGLSDSDVVVVEGLTKVDSDTLLAVTMMSPDELNIPASK